MVYELERVLRVCNGFLRSMSVTYGNMVPKGQLSVKDNTQVYFFGATKNWCTAGLRALVF